MYDSGGIIILGTRAQGRRGTEVQRIDIVIEVE